MSATTTSTQLDPQVILGDIAKWRIRDLESFAQEVNHLVARRKSPSLSKREAELIKKINHGLPLEFQMRYRELGQKMVDEIITPQEHEELGKMIPKAEAWTVERLKYLVELSQLRNTTLDKVMRQLKIKTPEPLVPSHWS